MKTENRRLLKNTVAQYFKVIFGAVTSLITVRIVLNELGVDDYGIFSLIAGLMAFLGVLTSAMVVSTQRYISAELALGNNDNIKHIYSASVYIHIWLSLIMFIVAEAIGVYLINHILNFSQDKLYAVNVVYQCTIISFVLNVISIPQQGVLIAYEKLIGASVISSAESLLKLLSALSLSLFSDNKLIVYAIFTACVAFIIRISYNIYVIKITKLRYYSKFNRVQIRQLSSFAGWNMLGGIANIGKIQGTNIILNLFYNTSLNASFGIANQVNSQLLFFSSSIFQSSNSQTIQAYQQGDKDRLDFLIIKLSKLAFALLFIITAPIFLFSDDILYLWLNNVPKYCSDFLRLMLINSYIELFSTPLMFLMQANGNIKRYFISISITMLAVLPISYYLLKIGFNPPIVFLSNIGINIIALCIRLEFSRSVAKYNYRQYLIKSIIKAFICAVIILSIGSFVYRTLCSTSSGSIICIYIVISYIIITFATCILLFSKSEICRILKR